MSTTTVSKHGLVTKSALVATAVVMGISSPMALTSQAFADRWDDQMRALNAQMQQYQSQASALNAQANTLQAQLDQITAQKNAILAQIDLSQKQYDALQKQIEETKQKIDDNKEALGRIIADMYVDGSITPLEMLASSKNIGDYVDQQEYRNSIQNTLSDTIDQINSLKKKLESKQNEVKKVLDQQKDQKAQLAAKEAEQAELVAKTRNDEAAYQQMANDAKAQVENAAAQQRAYYASLQQQSGGRFTSGIIGGLTITGFSGNRGCGGGYPFCAGPLDYGVDPWNLYTRECVSYAAWRIQNGYGKPVAPFRGDGMAYEWEWSARKGNGTKATRVSDPAPGDAVVLPITPGLAPVGHLMVVEGVSGDNVYVSQYNFGGTGEYSTMTISKSASRVIYLRF